MQVANIDYFMIAYNQIYLYFLIIIFYISKK